MHAECRQQEGDKIIPAPVRGGGGVAAVEAISGTGKRVL